MDLDSLKGHLLKCKLHHFLKCSFVVTNYIVSEGAVPKIKLYSNTDKPYSDVVTW